MATLQKINPKEHKRYHISRSMGCGDGYKNGKKHEFKSENKDHVKLLIFIMKALRVEISEETETSFQFQAESKRFQKAMFKMCRYVRTEYTLGILDNIKSCILNGVKPYNAFFIGHLLSHITVGNNGDNERITSTNPNYVNSMDVVPCAIHTFQNKVTFRSWSQFLHHIRTVGGQNNLYSLTYRDNINHYPSRNTNDLKKLFQLLKDKNYLEIQRFMYHKYTGKNAKA